MKMRGGRPDMRLLRTGTNQIGRPSRSSSVRGDPDRGRWAGLGLDLARVIFFLVRIVAQQRSKRFTTAGEDQAVRRIVRHDVDARRQNLGENRRELLR